MSVREDHTGLEEAPFTGTPRQICISLLLSGTDVALFLCIQSIRTIKKRSPYWSNLESELLSSGAGSDGAHAGKAGGTNS
jgi:hypothetical protein